MSEQAMQEIIKRIKDRRQELKLSFQDIADLTGMSKSTLQRYETGGIKNIPLDRLKVLASALRVSPSYLMGWEETETLAPSNIMRLKTKKIPLLGTIAAGVPILAHENIEDYIDVEDFTKADFCLKIQGDSMINAGINHSDIVFVKSQPDVEDSEIAAVLIEGHEDYSTTATLKRIYHYDDSIQLISDNPTYKPITLNKANCQSVNIIGKVTHVLTPVK